MPKTWIVVPAYNEENGLPPLLATIRRLMEEDRRDYHVFVVNDGSRDRTREVALAAGRSMPLDVLEHEVNRNVGAAFRTGLTEACRRAAPEDSIVTIEGDNTNDPSIVLEIVRKREEGYDVVVASRYRRGGCFQGFPLKRRICSHGINTMLRVMYPVRGITDYSIFYRAYHAAVLQRALAHYGPDFIESAGFVSNAEMLIKLRPFDIRGAEVPLRYLYDQKAGKSKMRVGRTIAEYFQFFRRLRRTYRKHFPHGALAER